MLSHLANHSAIIGVTVYVGDIIGRLRQSQIEKSWLCCALGGLGRTYFPKIDVRRCIQKKIELFVHL